MGTWVRKVRRAAQEQIGRSPRSGTGSGGSSDGKGRARIKGKYSAANISEVEVTTMLRRAIGDEDDTGIYTIGGTCNHHPEEDGKATCLLPDSGSESDGELELDFRDLQVQETKDPVACL
jgi:hypothetical protein